MCGLDSDFFPECKSKSISGCFIHQPGILGVKCFQHFFCLILAVSKSGKILMPNDLIVLGFCSLINIISWESNLISRVCWVSSKSYIILQREFLFVSIVMVHLLPHRDEQQEKF